MTPEESRRLGAGILETYEAWASAIPEGVRRGFGGDRARLLCGALLLPHVLVTLLPSAVERAYAASRARSARAGNVSMPALRGEELRLMRTYIEIDSMDLVLAATVVLCVDRLEANGRSEEVPEALLAGAALGLALGLEVRR